MTILRYLSRDIIFHTIAVSLILLLIIFTGRMSKYLAEAAVGEIPGDILFPLMFFRIPGFMELILPLGLFIGILMSYGRLYVNSEMVVLFASGVGNSLLLFYTLVPAGLVAVLVSVLSLIITPIGVEKSRMLLEDPKLIRDVNSLVSGRFQIKDHLGSTTYTESIDQEGVMHGIFLLETNRDLEKPSITVTVAQRGELKKDSASSGNQYMELTNGARYKGIPGELAYEVIEFDRYGELMRLSQDGIRKVSAVDSKSTAALFISQEAEDIAALQWRISLPLATLILALIAQSMSRTNPRKGRYMTMLPAFLIYVFYILALGAVRGRIENDKLFFSGEMWLVHFIFFLVAIGLTFGSDYWNSIRYRLAKN
tara:strand:- start:3456 stop:4559 length:1104 start_codon:yes stop_codon:yes gene_type:complete